MLLVVPSLRFLAALIGAIVLTVACWLAPSSTSLLMKKQIVVCCQNMFKNHCLMVHCNRGNIEAEVFASEHDGDVKLLQLAAALCRIYGMVKFTLIKVVSLID
jgi:hypothetical protein